MSLLEQYPTTTKEDDCPTTTTNNNNNNKGSSSTTTTTSPSLQRSILRSCKVSPRMLAVTFGVVHIRYYHQTVGDNPAVSSHGPPLTLDWTYEHPPTVLSLETYEAIRRQPLQQQQQPMRWSSAQRYQKLHMVWGVSGEELQRASHAAQVIQQQRQRTLQTSRKRSNSSSNRTARMGQGAAVSFRQQHELYQYLKTSSSPNGRRSMPHYTAKTPYPPPLLRRKSSRALAA